MLSMEWTRLDFNKGTCTVPPKALGWKGFKGEMAVNSYMLSILKERIAEGGLVESQCVFPARHCKSGHMIDTVESVYLCALAALGAAGDNYKQPSRDALVSGARMTFAIDAS